MKFKLLKQDNIEVILELCIAILAMVTIISLLVEGV